MKGTVHARRRGCALHRGHADGRCHACVAGLDAALPVVRPGPGLVRGVRQHAALAFPVACPHCHAAPPAWHVEWGYARCVLCGEDCFLASDPVPMAPPAA